MKITAKTVFLIFGIVVAELLATNIFASVKGPRVGASMIILFTLFIHPLLMIIVWFGFIRDPSVKGSIFLKYLCIIALMLAYPIALNMVTGYFVGSLIQEFFKGVF